MNIAQVPPYMMKRTMEKEGFMILGSWLKLQFPDNELQEAANWL